MSRPDLDTYFLNIATAVSARGDCLRDKVGCVIVDRMNRIISTGYNGTYARKPGCTDGACVRGNLIRERALRGTLHDAEDHTLAARIAALDCDTFHAEVNACIYIRPTHTGPFTAYVTRKPCAECHELLVRHGVGWIVYPNPHTLELERIKA